MMNEVLRKAITETMGVPSSMLGNPVHGSDLVVRSEIDKADIIIKRCRLINTSTVEN
jgi:hypothetical protein